MPPLVINSRLSLPWSGPARAKTPRTKVRGSPSKVRASLSKVRGLPSEDRLLADTSRRAGGFSPRSKKERGNPVAPRSAGLRLRPAGPRTDAKSRTGGQFPLAILALLLALGLSATGGCAPASGDGSGTAPSAAGQTSQPKLTVAAAASLAGVLPEIKERFLAEHPGVQVEIVFGSSGAFYAQLTNQAPFDLFLSADTMYPQKLIQQGIARRDDYRVYAQGQVVLWVPKDSPLEVEQGLPLLLQKRVRRVALANPATAPYGKAAVEALKHYKLYHQVQAKLVHGENVSHAAQMVQSGAADCGLIALSLAVSPRLKHQGRWYVIPPQSYRPIRQGLVVVKQARQPELARRFVQFLFTPEARELFAKYGFSNPEPVR